MDSIDLLVMNPYHFTAQAAQFGRSKRQTFNDPSDVPERLDLDVISNRKPLFNNDRGTSCNIAQQWADRLTCNDDEYRTGSDGGCSAPTNGVAFNRA